MLIFSPALAPCLNDLRNVGEEAASQGGFDLGDFLVSRRHGVSSGIQRSMNNWLQSGGLIELSFDDRNQIFTLLVHLILRIEQGTTFLVALGFEGLDLLLPG
jgi:hypothetical protein